MGSLFRSLLPILTFVVWLALTPSARAGCGDHVVIDSPSPASRASAPHTPNAPTEPTPCACTGGSCSVPADLPPRRPTPPSASPPADPIALAAGYRFARDVAPPARHVTADFCYRSPTGDAPLDPPR